jgi:hypothetical protein
VSRRATSRKLAFSSDLRQCCRVRPRKNTRDSAILHSKSRPTLV